MISKSPEDQQFYEPRLKFLRDQEALRLEQEANLQAARAEGMAKGRECGLLVGKILVIQELLGESPTPAKQLQSMTMDELTSLLTALQTRLDERENS